LSLVICHLSFVICRKRRDLGLPFAEDRTRAMQVTGDK